MSLLNDQDVKDFFSSMQSDDFNSRQYFERIFRSDVVKKSLPDETLKRMANIAAETWGLPKFLEMEAAFAQVSLGSWVNTESVEKAPTLRLGDITYQGLMDLIAYYQQHSTLTDVHKSDILDYFSELFSVSQFTGFIDPMVQFIRKQGWDSSTTWVADQMVHIPKGIDSQDDFAIILKQSQLLNLIHQTPSTRSWKAELIRPLELFFQFLPTEQVPMIANQLPAWVLQQMVTDYSENPSKISNGRLELMIREVQSILADRQILEGHKTITNAIDLWVEAIKLVDPVKIHEAELTVKIALNKPDQSIMALINPLNEWIKAQQYIAPNYLEKMEQISLFYHAVPSIRKLLTKIYANSDYVLTEIDRSHIQSWWPVIEPFLKNKIEETILEDLRTPVCHHIEKLEGLLGLPRDAIIITLQNQLKVRS